MTGPDDDTGAAGGNGAPEEHDDPTEEPEVRDDLIHIYQFDPDETVRSRLAAAVAEGRDDVTHDGTGDLETARDRLVPASADDTDGADADETHADDSDTDDADPAVDVFVVEPDAPGDVAGLVAAVDVPVALYTSVDPGDIDPAVFAEADTLVEKWTAEEGLDFVVEKIVGAARTTTSPDSRFTPAFDRVDPETQSSSCFLVYADGTAIWESTPLADLFDRRDVAVTLPDTPNFYKQLSAALSHDPEAIRTIRGQEVPDEPTRFSVPTDEGRAWFRYSEHEFPETVGPLRLIVVEDVTWSERSDARFELLELLDEHVQDGISVVDANGRIEYHNDSFTDLLGHEDMVGEHAAAFMSEGELASGQQLIQQLRASDRDSGVIDMAMETSGGEKRTLATHFSVRNADGEYEGLVNVARDVTDRRDRERRLEQYRRLVESAGDPMYVTDEDGCVEICNDRLAELFDRSREAVDGTRLADLLPERAIDAICEALSEAGEGGESATCEFDLETAGGEVRQFEATVADLADTEGFEGGIPGSVGILHEVTERERRESELDLLKQVLARVLRHDVRTGLTVVRGQAEVLAERTSGEEQRMAETIVDRSEELVGTAEKARAIERVIENDDGRVSTDLRSVVNRAVANVSAAYPEAAYDVQITEQLPVRVHQAFPYAVENLVENAVEHSSTIPDSQDRADEPEPAGEADGGTTRTNVSAPSVTVTADRTDDTVHLRIADDGPGISQAELDVLESREETPLEHGTGVGLWLVSWVVERSGGDLDFETGSDGTTATVRLDAADAADLT